MRVDRQDARNRVAGSYFGSVEAGFPDNGNGKGSNTVGKDVKSAEYCGKPEGVVYFYYLPGAGLGGSNAADDLVDA